MKNLLLLPFLMALFGSALSAAPPPPPTTAPTVPNNQTTDDDTALMNARKEVEQLQRQLFDRRRQLMTENEEIRRLRAQIAELEGKVNTILSQDAQYAALESRRQRLRDELAELYRRRAQADRENAKPAELPAPPPTPVPSPTPSEPEVSPK